MDRRKPKGHGDNCRCFALDAQPAESQPVGNGNDQNVTEREPDVISGPSEYGTGPISSSPENGQPAWVGHCPGCCTHCIGEHICPNLKPSGELKPADSQPAEPTSTSGNTGNPGKSESSAPASLKCPECGRTDKSAPCSTCNPYEPTSGDELRPDLEQLQLVNDLLARHHHHPCDMGCPSIDDDAALITALIEREVAEAWHQGHHAGKLEGESHG